MKGRNITIVMAGIVFLLALVLTLYPVISNLYNQKHQSQIHTVYEKVIQQADTRELDHIRELAEAYNAAIVPGTAEEAYSQAALIAASEDYRSQLDPGGNGIMCYVEIPVIGVHLPVYHGTGSDSLERGVGHLLGSSLPVGGASTHAVLTGHSGMASQKLFTDLGLVQKGDVFYLHVLNEVLAYEVDAIHTVLPHDTSLLGISPGEDYCTLITCTPIGINTHRLLVRGHRIPYEPEKEPEKLQTVRENKQESNWENQYMLGLCLGILAMMIGIEAYIIVLLIQRRGQRRRGRYVKR